MIDNYIVNFLRFSNEHIMAYSQKGWSSTFCIVHTQSHRGKHEFHEKKTPNDAVTPQGQSQFTPKTKANAVPRLLSSLVWIDWRYGVTASFGVFFHEIKCNGMTSFIEFMFTPMRLSMNYAKGWTLSFLEVPLLKYVHCLNLRKFTISIV